MIRDLHSFISGVRHLTLTSLLKPAILNAERGTPMRESRANSLVFTILSFGDWGSGIVSQVSRNSLISFREIVVLVLLAIFSTAAAVAQALRGTLIHEETI